MIALHIAYHEGDIHLWSETDQIGNYKDIEQAFKMLGLKRSSKKQSNTYFVWLPGKAGKKKEALPSHSLIRPKPSGRFNVRLIPFPVETMIPDFEILTDLFLAASSSKDGGSGVIFGNSVIWLANLFAVSVDIVIRELFVPVIEMQEDSFYALWKPVPDETRDRYLRRLLKDMPASLRCLSADGDNPPTIPGEYLLSRVLEFFVDKLIRMNRDKYAGLDEKNSIHDAWLVALRSEDGILNWENREELRNFYKQLSAWNRQIFLSSKSPVKLCFRLIEPEKEDGDWVLEYLLQSKEDPGLLIPMSLLWSKKKEDRKKIKNIGLNSVEIPLLLMGQAAGLYPLLSESFNANQMRCLNLDTSGVLQFLFDYADILSRMGFSIMLPSWWKGQNTESKLKLKLEVKSPDLKSGAGMDLKSILRFNYQASLGDEKMTLKELAALAKLKSPLVKIRGQWTFIDPQKIQECINFLKKQNEAELNVSDLIQIHLGNRPSPVPIGQINVSGWVKGLLEGLSEKKKFKQLKQPQTFVGDLRHYQIRGYSWLSFLKQWGFGACLADDMGLGKTIQTLALIQNDVDSGEKRPVLLICPTTVLNNWLKEAQRFTPKLEAVVHHGSDRAKGKKFTRSVAGKSLVISSFGLLHRDIESFQEVNWAGIVVDEAQNVKNHRTKSSQAVRSLAADYRIALTGTPVENHVGDLWSIMEFLNPGMLGNIKNFKERFHKPITLYQDDNATDNLKRIVSPFILRRLKTDKKIIKDLPDKIESKEYCTLTKEQVSLYQAVADEVKGQVDNAEGINRKGLVLAALTRLKQVCNHPAHYYQDNSEVFNRSGKLQRTLELLSEIYENRERTLIFTQYSEMGAILQQVIQQHFGREVLFLHGKVTKKKRDDMLERFQKSENAPYFFILSLKAGGTGITLTNANNVIHYDRWWNPAVEQQATDRAFRIGQHKNVQVHKLIVAGTLEEKIDDLIMRKEQVATKVVGTGEAWLTELSNSDFKSLISLSKSAIGDE